MRTSIKIVLAFFALVAILGIGLTLFSGDSEARTCVWDGGDASVALASDATNWDTDTAPVAGDNILFDGLHLVNASADAACTWNLATNSFGTFTIAAGYSGTITQSSDMYITGYSQAGGTFTGVITKWVYCNGSITKTSGTFTASVSRLYINNNYVTTINNLMIFHTINNYGNLTVKNNVYGTNYVYLNIDSILNIDTSKTFWYYVNNGCIIEGTINGPGSLLFYANSVSSNLPVFNAISNNLNIIFYTESSASDRTIIINSDLNIKSVNIYSTHAVKICTLNLNGHSLTASTITVGTQGILSNSAATDSTVTCTAFTSTSGTFNHAGIILTMTDGTITATANEQFETIYATGYIDIINQIEVTESFMFVNVDTSYGDIDVYLDTVYDRTIPSPYELGIGIKAGVKYEYLPDIQITLGQFYEDVDFSIYASISSNLPVTYNITGTASSWLTYHEGQIVGMPPDIGNYTYIITATHESGSVDIVSGYIPVGTISTAEYNFDFIWGLLLWSVITLFMLFGYLREIPLMQMVVWAISFGNIVATIRIENFAAFVALFAICNTIIFFIGMARWRS